MKRSAARPIAATTAARLGLALGLGLVVSACSVSVGSTPANAAEDAIEDGLSELLGLELSDATCTEPRADEPGETFSCSATSDSGESVNIDGVVEENDGIYVAATNVVLTDDLSDLEEEAIVTLAPDSGLPPERIDVDCPAGPTVFDGDVLVCEISDNSTGERFELNVELTDFVLREGWTSRRYAIGAPIE